MTILLYSHAGKIDCEKQPTKNAVEVEVITVEEAKLLQYMIGSEISNQCGRITEEVMCRRFNRKQKARSIK